MKNTVKFILSGVFALVLSGQASASNLELDKALVQAEISANIEALKVEINMSDINKIDRQELKNIKVETQVAKRTNKAVATPVVAMTAE